MLCQINYYHTIYREIKNNQDQIDMQRDLDALMDWGSTWGMKFN